MSQSTTQRGGPSEAACDEASESIRGFVSGLLPVEQERALRAHLDRCGDCRDHYRAAVMTTAHIGHERRLERDARQKRVRRERLRSLAREGQPAGRPSFFRLRTLLYPAFFAFLMWQVSGLLTRNSGARVERLEGRVTAGPLELFSGRGAAPLGIGQRCSTAVDASARVEAGATGLVLGPHTDLVLESIEPLRVRLGRGSLQAHGTCVVTTRLGIVDVTKGGAEVALGRGALQIKTLVGECVFTGPDGARTIERGASLVVPTMLTGASAVSSEDRPGPGPGGGRSRNP